MDDIFHKGVEKKPSLEESGYVLIPQTFISEEASRTGTAKSTPRLVGVFRLPEVARSKSSKQACQQLFFDDLCSSLETRS